MYYKEVRRYLRYPVSTKAVITRKDEGLSERLTMQVINISQGGMGVYSNMFMKKAAPVSVELLSYAHDGMTKADIFEGRIASVCSQGRDYFVGITFDREISYDRFIDIIS
ncbi:MAG: PilZ domain-containing protein [Nitrospirae bacterium]|nr:PilZ domain-containing protein [Nitrospirota bacterium]MBI3377495.1 PilZ domain-containing protein [Nitrospirota bacterium]